jgi:hypothetical protein
VSEEAKRIEERLNRIAGSDEATVGEAYDYLDYYEQDVAYLLNRIEALERMNRRYEEFVEYVNEEVPKMNSRFEEWLL